MDLSEITNPEYRHLAKSTLQFFLCPDYFVFKTDRNADNSKTSDDNIIVTMKIKQFIVANTEPKTPLHKTKFVSDKNQKEADVNQPLYSGQSETIIETLRRLLRGLSLKLPFTNPLHIPVKRLFLKPPQNASSGSWFLEHLKQAKANTFVLPGGAEQNLAFCHLINRHRWNEKSKEAPRIGFFENEFDCAYFTDSYNFLVGTEDFVYSYNASRGTTKPDIENDFRFHKKNHADIIKIYLDEIPIIIIYGYHAISTKIASVKYFWLSHFTQEEIQQQKQEIQELYNTIQKHNIHFEMEYPLNKDWESLKQYWDENNPLSHSIPLDTDIEPIRLISIKDDNIVN